MEGPESLAITVSPEEEVRTAQKIGITESGLGSHFINTEIGEKIISQVDNSAALAQALKNIELQSPPQQTTLSNPTGN